MANFMSSTSRPKFQPPRLAVSGRVATVIIDVVPSNARRLCTVRTENGGRGYTRVEDPRFGKDVDVLYSGSLQILILGFRKDMHWVAHRYVWYG